MNNIRKGERFEFGGIISFTSQSTMNHFLEKVQQFEGVPYLAIPDREPYRESACGIIFLLSEIKEINNRNDFGNRIICTMIHNGKWDKERITHTYSPHTNDIEDYRKYKIAAIRDDFI